MQKIPNFFLWKREVLCRTVNKNGELLFLPDFELVQTYFV